MIFTCLIISQSFGLSTYGSTCFDFSCESLFITDTITPCVSVNETTNKIVFAQCDINSNLTCNYFQYYLYSEPYWQDVYCSSAGIILLNCDYKGTSLTGANCCVDQNCFSGNCFNGICLGLPIGSTCNTTEQCDSFAYCQNNKCIATVGAGQSCYKDDCCSPGFGCNFQQCVQIFSLPLGSPTENAKFCSTNFEVSNFCDILTVQIQGSAYTLYSPFLCEEGNTCVYWTSNGTYYGSTECKCAGYKHLPEGFCGDYLPNVATVMDVVYPQLMYTYSECAGSEAHSSDPKVMLDCKSITTEQYTFFFNIYNQAKYWNLFVTGSLDDCAEAFGLWDPNYTYRNFNLATFIHVTFLTAFLI